MSYKNIDDDDFERDLLERKEFYQYKSDPDFNFKHPAPDTLANKIPRLSSYQQFSRNYLSPNTPFQRILLNHACHGPGTLIEMATGIPKPVESLAIGDMVCGEHGLAVIASLHTGQQEMYRITIGDLKFTCNAHHLLTCFMPPYDRDNTPASSALTPADSMPAQRGATCVGPIDIPAYLVAQMANSRIIKMSRYGVLLTFTIESIGVGTYFGFGLTGKSQRYYLAGGVLTHNTGTGKCLDGDTPVMMFDGGIKTARDVRIGDALVGDAGEKRIVEACCIGRAQMYRVTLATGDQFVCNDEHIITIANAAGDVIDVSLIDYLEAGQQDGWGMIKYVAMHAPHAPYAFTITHKPIAFTATPLGAGEYYGFTVGGNGRFVLGNGIITHNTMSALSIATEFIKSYKVIYNSLLEKTNALKYELQELDRTTPSVFYLGFQGSRVAALRDLWKNHEFDIVTYSEALELNKRQHLAQTGTPSDVAYYVEMQNKLKRRVVDKKLGGFYKFYGYQEFVNRLFEMESITLVDINTQFMQRLKNGEIVSLEDMIYDAIRAGKLRVNQKLLMQLKNSLIIADEVHNTYNSKSKNNYGVAIQYVLDTVPGVRLVMTTATPFNNSPMEVIDVLNYLMPPNKKLSKSDFFENERTLKPGKLEELGRISRGYVSFLQDVNPIYYPSSEFAGSPIKMPKAYGTLSAGDEVPYLKFIECPMSELHQRTVEKTLIDGYNMGDDENTAAYTDGDGDADADGRSAERNAHTLHALHAVGGPTAATGENIDAADVPTGAHAGTQDGTQVGMHAGTPEDADESDDGDIDVARRRANTYDYHGIPTDGSTLFDGVFPNPAGGEVDPAKMEIGLFRSKNVLNMISSAQSDWQTKVGIAIKKQGNIRFATGAWLQAENVKHYFSKLYQLHNTLKNTPPNEKIAIWHYNVRMNGVVLIQEFLKSNGYIDEHSSPTDTTICAICNKMQSEHEPVATQVPIDDQNIDEVAAGKHMFVPSRFIMMYADIDKAQMMQAYSKYNGYDNRYGHKFRIMVGSKLIRESYDFKCIRHMMFMSMATNISMLIQLFGRPVRKGSHADLPAAKRNVKFYMYVTTVNKKYAATDNISPELYKYVDKLDDYRVIQQISREINKNAIDADIHRDIIMPDALRAKYFDGGSAGAAGSAAGGSAGTGTPKAMIGNLYFDHDVKVQKLERANEITFNAYGHYMNEIKLITYLIKRLFLVQPVWKIDDLWAAVRRPPFVVESNPALFDQGNFRIALNHLTSTVEYTTQIALTDLERLINYDDSYVYRAGAKYKIVAMGEFYVLCPMVAPHTAIEKHMLIKDVESYIRPPKYTMNVSISVKTFVQHEIAQLNFEHMKLRLKTILTSKNPNEILVSFNSVFQRRLLEEIIAGKVRGALGEKALQESYADAVLSIYYAFGVIIKAREVKKYKVIADQFDKRLLAIGDEVPIGYVAHESVRLFNYVENKWFDVNRLSMNRQSMFEENDIIIGILEDAGDEVKFKVRPPVERLRSVIKQKRDMRLIDRGMVCSTKNKGYLLKLMGQLDIKIPRADLNFIGIKALCGSILSKVLAREQYERQRMGKYKWVYFWWDETVNI